MKFSDFRHSEWNPQHFFSREDEYGIRHFSLVKPALLISTGLLIALLGKFNPIANTGVVVQTATSAPRPSLTPTRTATPPPTRKPTSTLISRPGQSSELMQLHFAYTEDLPVTFADTPG